MTTVTTSTSVVLVDTTTNTSPYIVYLPYLSTVGRIITVRDNNGFCSTGNTILLSTTENSIFSDGTSTIQINQHYGFITLTSQPNGIYDIVNTFAFPTGSDSVYASNINANIYTIKDSNSDIFYPLGVSSTTLVFNNSTIGNVTDTNLTSTFLFLEGQISTLTTSNNQVTIRRYVTTGYPQNIGNPYGSIQFSYTGTDWKIATGGTGGFPYGGLAVGVDILSGLFVSCGNNTDLSNPGLPNTGFIQYSFDGITWNNSASPSLYAHQIRTDVAFNNGLWHAVGYNSILPTAQHILWSRDGSNWNTSENMNNIFTNCTAMLTIAYGKGTWVSGGINTDLASSLLWSRDGSNWNPAFSIPLYGNKVVSIIFNGTVFIALVDTSSGPYPGSNIAISPDGSNWTFDNISGQPASFEIGLLGTSGFAYGGMTLLLTGSSHKYSLDNGFTWLTIDNSLPYGAVGKPHYDGSMWWVGASGNGSSAVTTYYSANGSNNWTNEYIVGGFQYPGYMSQMNSINQSSNLNIPLISTVAGLGQSFAISSFQTNYISSGSFSLQNIQNYSSVVYSFLETDGPASFKIPYGINQVNIQCVGGGGGNYSFGNVGGSGGNGAYLEGTLNVTPGDSYSIQFGKGGTSLYGAKGGSYAAIKRGDTLLVVAGGGGGGGSSGNDGGHGGLDAGLTTIDQPFFITAEGGTQLNGGQGAIYINDSKQAGNGDLLKGGDGYNNGGDLYYGGGGGAGYYGGGAGIGDFSLVHIGGAGGSSYSNSTQFSPIRVYTGSDYTTYSVLSNIIQNAGQGSKTVTGQNIAGGPSLVVVSYYYPSEVYSISSTNPVANVFINNLSTGTLLTNILKLDSLETNLVTTSSFITSNSITAPIIYTTELNTSSLIVSSLTADYSITSTVYVNIISSLEYYGSTISSSDSISVPLLYVSSIYSDTYITMPQLYPSTLYTNTLFSEFSELSTVTISTLMGGFTTLYDIVTISSAVISSIFVSDEGVISTVTVSTLFGDTLTSQLDITSTLQFIDSDLSLKSLYVQNNKLYFEANEVAQNPGTTAFPYILQSTSGGSPIIKNFCIESADPNDLAQTTSLLFSLLNANGQIMDSYLQNVGVGAIIYVISPAISTYLVFKVTDVIQIPPNSAWKFTVELLVGDSVVGSLGNQYNIFFQSIGAVVAPKSTTPSLITIKAKVAATGFNFDSADISVPLDFGVYVSGGIDATSFSISLNTGKYSPTFIPALIGSITYFNSQNVYQIYQVKCGSINAASGAYITIDQEVRRLVVSGLTKNNFLSATNDNNGQGYAIYITFQILN